jgi:protein required for attachment to host cells
VDSVEQNLMELGGITWIVALDGGRACFFEERNRAGDVRELPDKALEASEEDRPRSHRHMASVHERAGVGRHAAGARDLSDETARRFIRRTAASLAAADAAHAYDALVLIAPPKALGLLRAELPPSVAEKVTASDDHDYVRLSASEIRNRLRKIRANA